MFNKEVPCYACVLKGLKLIGKPLIVWIAINLGVRLAPVI